jgi:predicted signal transduction protein with EAL and GGDEF domain
VLKARAGARATVSIAINASIGVALYPDHGREIEALLFRADIAMYSAKHDGGGVRMYGEDLEETPGAVAGQARRDTVRHAGTARH